jgi:hypothetical protein
LLHSFPTRRSSDLIEIQIANTSRKNFFMIIVLIVVNNFCQIYNITY